MKRRKTKLIDVEFKFTRFVKLIKSELLINYKNLIALGAVVIIPFLITIVFAKLDDNSWQTLLLFFMPVLGVLCCFSPFALYKNIFHNIKGVSYSMLPASNTEKFASIWLLSTIVVPLFLFFVFLICVCIISFIFGMSIPRDLINYIFKGFAVKDSGISTFFESPFWSMISCQAIAIWGICFFRTHKLRKTILTLVAIGTGISVLAGLLFMHILHDTKPIDIYFNMETQYIWNTLIVFALWGWSYFKFTRQQV